MLSNNMTILLVVVTKIPFLAMGNGVIIFLLKR